MAAPLYLLDTNILLHLIRGSEIGQRINDAYDLSNAVYRPLISVISKGELAVLANRNGWGDKKREAMQVMFDNLVTIDLNHPAVIEAYATIAAATRAQPIKTNDQWIAACTLAAEATLLTTDKNDFGKIGAVINVVFPDVDY